MNVISMAFFRQDASKNFDFDSVVKSNHFFFPGWENRIYHGKLDPADPHKKVLEAYADQGLVTLVFAEEHQLLCRSMLWRVMPLYDDNVDFFTCRDLDSMAMLKDRMMVERWIESGAAVHVINDNPQHTVPMMGGMIGFNAKCVQAFDGFLDKFPDWPALMSGHRLDYKGSDQHFLERVIWPYAQRSLCEHRLAGYSTMAGAVYSSTSVEVQYSTLMQIMDDVTSSMFTVTKHMDWDCDPCFVGDMFSCYVGACGYHGNEFKAAFLKLARPDLLERFAKAEKACS